MRACVAIDTELIEPDAAFLSQAPSAVEVNWAVKRLAIFTEVDNSEAVKGFVGSEEYVALSDIRRKSANSYAVVAQGRN